MIIAIKTNQNLFNPKARNVIEFRAPSTGLSHPDIVKSHQNYVSDAITQTFIPTCIILYIFKPVYRSQIVV